MSNLASTAFAAATINVNASAISISAICVVNIGLLLWLGSREAETDNRKIALWAHSLWSGMWLMWLLAWLAQSGTNSHIAVTLEDLGAFLLIGCAVVRLWGLEGLKRYAKIFYPIFVVVDLAWPLAVYFEWIQTTRGDVFYNTLMFSPSLCLVVFAMGLFGWAQLRGQTNSVIRFTSAFAAGGYALIQVLVYQAYLLAGPDLVTEVNSVLWKSLLVTWRAFFVFVYWVEVLTWVGVRFPEGRARQLVSKLAWLPPVIVTVVLERLLGKH
jgi:hypothetical protein